MNGFDTTARRTLRTEEAPHGLVGVVHSGDDLEAWWIRKDGEEIEPTAAVMDRDDLLYVVQGTLRLELAGRGSEVSLVVRGPDIAAEMSAYLVDRLLAHPRVTVQCQSEVTRLDGGDFLQEVSITDRIGNTTRVQPCSALFCFIGAEPATSWLTGIAIEGDGFIRTDVQLTGDDLGPGWAEAGRRPLPFETSVPGVFAVGDVRSGSMKRVAAATGEGASAIASVHKAIAQLA